jgi:hypothetical protein
MQNSLAFMKEQNAILQKRLDELQDSRVVALQVLQERHAKETIALIEYKGKQCGGISAWQETLLASAYCAIGKLPPNDSILTVK